MAIKNGTSWQTKSDTLEENGKTNSLPYTLCLKVPKGDIAMVTSWSTSSCA